MCHYIFDKISPNSEFFPNVKIVFNLIPVKGTVLWRLFIFHGNIHKAIVILNYNGMQRTIQ